MRNVTTAHARLAAIDAPAFARPNWAGPLAVCLRSGGLVPDSCSSVHGSQYVRPVSQPHLTVLADLVRHVGSLSTEKQMVRADTRGVVAAVADVHSGRDGAGGEFPREPMGHDSTLTDFKRAVPEAITAPYPQPAALALLYAAPKALLRSYRHVLGRTPPRVPARIRGFVASRIALLPKPHSFTRLRASPFDVGWHRTPVYIRGTPIG